jgi:hypothetical protein
MCKVLYTFYQCGHKDAIIYPHKSCEHYLANVPLSGIDPQFKQNLRLCRVSRKRKVKTLEDEFCETCERRICDLSPRTAAHLAQELRELGKEKEQEHRLWLRENVHLACYLEDNMLEENAVDSEDSEMADPLAGKQREIVVSVD